MHGGIYLNYLNNCLINHFIIASVIKDFCGLAVDNANPGAIGSANAGYVTRRQPAGLHVTCGSETIRCEGYAIATALAKVTAQIFK